MTQPAVANQALPSSLSARLHELAHRHPLLVALDFDGVLAPLGDDPAAVTPLPEACLLYTSDAADE